MMRAEKIAVLCPAFGLGISSVAVPAVRDLLLRQHPVAAGLIAGIDYATLLLVALVAMRSAGISLSDAGIRPLSVLSVAIGVAGAFLAVAPVWHLSAPSPAAGGWLLLAVAVEEIVFRGVLFAALQRIGGMTLAVGGSAAAFTAAHAASAPWPSLVLVALAGLFLALLRSLRGDLWTCGIPHLLMDLTSLR